MIDHQHSSEPQVSHDDHDRRIHIERLWTADASDRERATLRAMLQQELRSIPPTYFYDGEGSELFDEICRLPEYYQTRTERHILQAIAPTVAQVSRAKEVLELGSGMATKTRVLLTALHQRGTLRRFVPFDVSEDVVRLVAHQIVSEYDGVAVTGIVGDFVSDLSRISPAADRLTVFLGGTIGNFPPPAAKLFMQSLGTITSKGETFLLGVDRIKSEARLEAAYNDAAGITARFNLNALKVVNERFGGNFDLQAFRHRAFYDADNHWIDVRLVSERGQHVTLTDLDLSFDLAAGEQIRTEISAKFDRPRVEALLAHGQFVIKEWFSDKDELFSVILAERS